MKKILFTILAMSLCASAYAQKVRYYNAAELNVIGKALPTTKDFTRIDTSAYKFNDKVIDEFGIDIASRVHIKIENREQKIIDEFGIDITKRVKVIEVQ